MESKKDILANDYLCSCTAEFDYVKRSLKCLSKVVSRPIHPFQNPHSKFLGVRTNVLLCDFFSTLDKEDINVKCSKFFLLAMSDYHRTTDLGQPICLPARTTLEGIYNPRLGHLHFLLSLAQVSSSNYHQKLFLTQRWGRVHGDSKTIRSETVQPSHRIPNDRELFPPSPLSL